MRGGAAVESYTAEHVGRFMAHDPGWRLGRDPGGPSRSSPTAIACSGSTCSRRPSSDASGAGGLYNCRVTRRPTAPPGSRRGRHRYSAGAAGRADRPLEIHLLPAVRAVRRSFPRDVHVAQSLVAVVTPVGTLRFVPRDVAPVGRLGRRPQGLLDRAKDAHARETGSRRSKPTWCVRRTHTTVTERPPPMEGWNTGGTDTGRGTVTRETTTDWTDRSPTCSGSTAPRPARTWQNCSTHVRPLPSAGVLPCSVPGAFGSGSAGATRPCGRPGETPRRTPEWPLTGQAASATARSARRSSPRRFQAASRSTSSGPPTVTRDRAVSRVPSFSGAYVTVVSRTWSGPDTCS